MTDEDVRLVMQAMVRVVRDLAREVYREELADDPGRRLFLSPEDAARRLGVSRTAMFELIKKRRVRTKKVGRRRLVLASSLVELADSDEDI